jgi:phosphotransferase system enzyme I (PtsI)
VLIGLGIRELSMSAVSVPEVKALIRATHTAEAEALVQRTGKLGTAAEVRAMVSDYVFGLTPHAGRARV